MNQRDSSVRRRHALLILQDIVKACSAEVQVWCPAAAAALDEARTIIRSELARGESPTRPRLAVDNACISPGRDETLT